MNIGIFTNAYHPITSGVVNAIDCIRQGLSRLGHEIYIIAPRYSGYDDRDDHVIRVPSIRLTRKADFPLPIPYFSKLEKKISALELDIVHTQHPFLLGALAEKIAAKKNIPLVFTFHTQYEIYLHYAPFFIPEALSRWYIRRTVSSHIKHCNAVVVPAPSILPAVAEYGGESKCHVIPNAIKVEKFSGGNGERIRSHYHLQNSKILIFVGRMAEEKNLSFLLAAFKKINNTSPETVLLLVGGGPTLDKLKKEAEALGLSHRVIFTGMVPYDEIPDYLKASDIFVMASTSEVKPLSLLESMASGLPIVAVRAPGAVDTVTDGQDGLLVNENTDEFAAAVIGLLKDLNRLEQMSKNASNKANKFGIPEFGKKLEELYKELLLERVNHKADRIK